MFGRGDKRGLSTIVATLLIILLTLVAVGIIWIVVRNVIQGGAEQISLGKFTLDLGISQVQNINDSALSITLKRNAGKGDFVGIAFIAEDDSNKEVVKRNISMNELDIKNFQLYFLTINVSRLKKISIAPIFRLESGKEVSGDIEDEYTIGGSSGISTCTPSCPLGAQCGSNGCGGSCGTCSNISLPNCINYQCSAQVCTPSCVGRVCGSDGCTGSCGTCSLANSVSQCTLAYQCTITSCNAGYSNCDSNVTNGCETALGTMTNCASCGDVCTIGQTCTNNVCTSPAQPCGAGTCESGEYCSTEAGVCLLQVSGNTYFVSTTGNDNNPGNFTHPWGTWQKAINVSLPGDITYMRGGVYYPVNRLLISSSHSSGNSGTIGNPIRYYNYPNERPIFDFINYNQAPNMAGNTYASGLVTYLVGNLEFKGFTMRNVRQIDQYTEVTVIYTQYSYNLKFENVIVHDSDGRGFMHEVETEYFGQPIDNSSFINCDAYNLGDVLETTNGSTPGNQADGFKIYGTGTAFLLYKGCRVWNVSDDGFDLGNDNVITIDNCWSFENGHFLNGDGDGFKTGGILNEGSTHRVMRIVTNNIAANNNISGYFLLEYPDYYRTNATFYNNIAYGNLASGYRFSRNIDHPEVLAVYRNNIAYLDLVPFGNSYQQYNESNNTWRLVSGYPGYEEVYSLTSVDFASLDVSQLMRPRKADGSLPDVTFGHLAPGSGLIDSGTVIPGYHCATVGAHPGENCREWYGSSPDIGAFESNY